MYPSAIFTRDRGAEKQDGAKLAGVHARGLKIDVRPAAPRHRLDSPILPTLPPPTKLSPLTSPLLSPLAATTILQPRFPLLQLADYSWRDVVAQDLDGGDDDGSCRRESDVSSPSRSRPAGPSDDRDSARCKRAPNAPNVDGKIRGVNLGGWFVLEREFPLLGRTDRLLMLFHSLDYAVPL